jgi:hypothetical protein
MGRQSHQSCHNDTVSVFHAMDYPFLCANVCISLRHFRVSLRAEEIQGSIKYVPFKERLLAYTDRNSGRHAGLDF